MALGTVSFTLGGADHVSFAVYSSDDGSLDFYKRMDVPEVGDTFEGKTVTAVYTGFENLNPKNAYDLPWNSIRCDVTSVRVVDSDISPTSLALWFKDMGKLASCDLLQLNLSRCNSLYGTFWNCTNIDQLDSISKWNVSHVSCMSDTFYGCKKLSSLDLDAWDTHSASTLDGVFYDCSGLTDLKIGKWDTSNADGLYYSFFNCSSLKYLDIANWDTGSFLTLNGTFRECVSLTTIDLSSWDLSSCKSMRLAFYLCSSLTELDCSNWNTSNITDMNFAFFACRSITELDVSNWDLSKCIDLSGTFESCDHLTSLDVSKWDVSNCTALWKTFQNCSSLSSLSIGEWVTNKVADIGCCFRDCGSITELDLSSWNLENVTAASECFKNTVSLRKITFGKNWHWVDSDGLLCIPDAKYISGANGKWYSMTTGNSYAPADIPAGKADTYVASKELLPKVAFAVYSIDDASLDFYNRAFCDVPAVGNTFEGKVVTDIYTGFENQVYYLHISNSTDYKYPTGAWYKYHSDIKTVSVIDGDIQPTHMDGWFSFLTNCSKFNGFDKIDYSKCVSLSYLFYACTSLTEFKLENIALPSCNLFGGMFESCTNLKTVDLSGWRLDKHDDIHLWFLFAQCTSLASIDLSGWDTSRVNNFSHTFYECTSLETLDISSFSSCTDGAILDGMFETCVKLRVINVGIGWLWASKVFPTPSSSHIHGADGKWYAASDGTGYAPADIPSGKADTYYAVAPSTFAVYSVDDGSLDFYNRAGKPVVGDTWPSKSVDGVYVGFETTSYNYDNSIPITDGLANTCSSPWYSVKDNIKQVRVIDSGIKASSLRC